MNPVPKDSQSTNWLTGVVVFLFAIWLFVNWPDFKVGFMRGYSAQTKSQR